MGGSVIRCARSGAVAVAAVGVLAVGGAVMTASPAGAAVNTCSSGTFYYNESVGALSNGTLYGGMCLASGTTSNDVRRVNVGYQKTGGSGVSVALGWELVNSNATLNGGSWWSSTINMSAGQTREVAFTYGGGVYKSGATPCFRSKMKDMISGQLFWGKIIC